MRLRELIIAALVLCLIPLVAQPARAENIVFSGASSTGTGSFSFTPGAGNMLSVSNALISSLLTTFGACTGSGCAVSGGSNLSLTSAGQTGVTTIGGTTIYSFGGGGLLNISGGVAALGIAPGSNLLTASFLPGANFIFSGTTTSSFGGNLNLASIILNPAIGSFNFTGGSDNQLFLSVAFSGGSYSGTVSNSSVNLQTAVPEPATLGILGAGLIGLAVILRRRGLGSLATRT